MLSFTQERLWFLEQFAPGTSFNNMSGVARVPVHVEPGLFRQCLDDMVKRHDILRTSFGMADGVPVGKVAEQVTVPLRVLTGVDDAERERLFNAEARTPFDLSTAPLLRVTIAPVSTDECLIQLTMHHIVSDGFSNGCSSVSSGSCTVRGRRAVRQRCRRCLSTSPISPGGNGSG